MAAPGAAWPAQPGCTCAADVMSTAVMQGARGGVELPSGDIERIRNHLAKYYAKMDETAPWERD